MRPPVRRRPSCTLRAALVACALQAVAASAAAFPALDVPLDHWAYEFLERIEVRAALPAGAMALRPLTRGEMAREVAAAGAAARLGTWAPTAIERAQLDMLRRELALEMRAHGGHGRTPRARVPRLAR